MNIYRRNSGKFVALIALSLTYLCFGVIGCGSDEVAKTDFKATWPSATTTHLICYYPEDSPRAIRMGMFVEECEEIYSHVLRVLAVESPEPLELFLLTTDEQSDSLFGRPAGFYADGRIVMKIGQHPGGYLALAACALIDDEAESFAILRDGLFQLYARPNVNVHAETYGYLRNNRFVPLAELADPQYPIDPAVRQAEAGSLTAYLLARYGAERFKMLWRSVLGFTESLEKIYRKELPQLEEDWIQYFQREAQRT